VKPWSQYWLIAAGAYPGFYSMKRLGVFLLPLDGMLVHRRSLPRNLLGFPNNSPVPIYTPGWREAPWELSVLPKNTTQCPLARARTRTARSGDQRTNHESTAPPTHVRKSPYNALHAPYWIMYIMYANGLCLSWLLTDRISTLITNIFGIGVMMLLTLY